MNRFQVPKDRAEAFEQVWPTRESRLRERPGFVALHMLRGLVREDHILSASHTASASRAAFEDWTRSEPFRLAHAREAGAQPLTLFHPEFEGVEVVRTLADPAARGPAA
ncbi:antibiotic biosynthesis monooxygenase family protein [Methylobacterium sp. WSM2598]|uniref:antibiotic biosynthesis monooxygenase family protein n=1 Tax=Methylobacterium sp. WSM2598 TaxID=398261 RepID=UPI00037B4812|nr:antibiotic biosynthesis monooxygenase [Methylobacterium sp. WSM2598]